MALQFHASHFNKRLERNWEALFAMETKVKISVLQGICATLILVAYFLPWLQISFMGFEGSTSLVEAIIQINKTAQKASNISPDTFSLYTIYPVLLLLIPALAFFNTIWQWIWNSPRFAFYLNLIPMIICALFIGAIVALTDFSKKNIDFTQFAGIGFYITCFATISSIIATWTTVGKHYYARYTIYMRTVTILAVISFLLMMTIRPMPYMDYLRSDMDKFKDISMYVVTFFFYTHTPFIIYAWIVVLCTKDMQRKVITDVNKTMCSIPLETDKVTIFPSPENICPQCHKPMAIDWNTCPYCGYNSKEEEEKKKQEEDNLRFAPPKYRKEN